MNRKGVIVPATIMLVWGQCALSATASQYLDLGIRYTSGDFSTAQTTTINQMELSYGFVQNDYDFSALLSYAQLNDGVNNESGIGDVIIRGNRKLYDEGVSGDYLYGTLAIKLPTADETKGLGTGELDIGGFINYTHRMDDVNLMFSAGYIITGDSSTVNYNDVANYGISLSKKFETILVYVNLDGSQQVPSTGDDPLDMSIGGFYQLNANNFIRASAIFGLSDGSLDYAYTIGWTTWI